MAKIHIKRAFTMDLDELQKGMQDLADQLQSEHGMQDAWKNPQQIDFKHKAGKGSLAIEGKHLVLSLKLGMLYAAMAPVVKSRINAWADEYIV